MELPDFEIVRLESPTNGCSCTIHDCYGRHVDNENVLRLVKTMISVDGQVEKAIACIKVVDGVDTCVVGFVPRVLAGGGRVVAHVNNFVQVKELYECSNNTYKRSKSKKNFGMASVCFLDENVGRNK